ncbi:hypothetical protein GCM10022215_43130 [Nocardioides fonticola]|uniref:DUF3352 domain-containing protein n=1 Tax=Nocardioides fonticola TaxID=450363 RepID=A0ABP7Y314_9ACTN
MRTRTALIGATAVAVVVAAVVLGTRVAGVWGGSESTTFERAVRMAPAESQRYAWTDWAGARRELGARVDADSTPREVGAFLDDAFTADLSSSSGLIDSTPMLQEKFGWSPASIDWELLAQSTSGAVEIVGLPADLDIDELADQVRALGYTPPSSPDGVWEGGEERLAAAAQGTDSDGTAAPTLENIAFLRDRHLLLVSDSADYLRTVLKGLDDTAATPVDDAAAGLVDAAGADPLAAVVYSGDYTCRTLAMAQADEQSQRQADQLIAAAGTVTPVTSFAMGLEADRSVRVVMGFERDDQARENADSRAALASGPAPGQGGDFADRFTLGPVEATGKLVTMVLRPQPDTFVLSDLSTGPVLFATC